MAPSPIHHTIGASLTTLFLSRGQAISTAGTHRHTAQLSFNCAFKAGHVKAHICNPRILR